MCKRLKGNGKNSKAVELEKRVSEREIWLNGERERGWQMTVTPRGC